MDDFVKYVVPAITALAALAAAIISLLNYLLTRTINQRTLNQKVFEEERKEIYKKLNSFYLPFQQLLEISRQNYEMFRASRGPEFRTLTALLRGDRFTGNDKVLLDRIIDVTQKLDNLIVSQSGLVEDKELVQLLGKASTHFQIVQKAYKGELTGETERFAGQVYPRELNPKIDEHISKLRARLDDLNRM